MAVLQQVLYPSDLARPVEIGKGIVYYASYGRNAWSSTWIQRYQQGALHNSFSSAKDHCEELRTQGSVFSIDELPAIVILTNARVVYITEINSVNPLCGYSGRYNDRRWREVSENKCHTKKINRLLSMAEIESSFLPGSPYWHLNPSPQNSVMIAEINHNGDPPEIKTRMTARRNCYASNSYGSDCLLGWRETPSKIKSGGVSRAYSKLITV